jgi:RimJ/RimL family protein N-acetyltransferase
VNVRPGALDEFETPRLCAERLQPHHFEELRRMHVDGLVMTHLGGVRTEAQTASYLEKNLKHWADHGFGLWILRERSGVEWIGRGLLRTLPLDGVDEVEVGYAFYEPFWGRGLASEITAACLAIAREQLRVETVVAVTSPDNDKSQRVLEKNGLVFDRSFMHEGVEASLFRIRWTRALAAIAIAIGLASGCTSDVAGSPEPPAGSYSAATVQVVAGDKSMSVSGASISADFLPATKLNPMLGRAFMAEDFGGRGTPVVLLGYDLWDRTFGREASIIGRVIQVDGRERTVVGIMPRAFSFPNGAQIWLPRSGPSPSLSSSA